MPKISVSGVPYKVEMDLTVKAKDETMNSLISDIEDLVAELERENMMMRARMDRLENELKIAEEHISKLVIDLQNERNKNAQDAK